ncbi:MAG: hypothetical protein EOP67_55000 [Sphingomonas sp.]|nr:MAG: hypothetical protein EOP67_55000 [Sphingomonas sp.]
MERKDWIRIGVAATVLLVPGGFVVGGLLAARRYRAVQAAEVGGKDWPTDGERGRGDGLEERA